MADTGNTKPEWRELPEEMQKKSEVHALREPSLCELCMTEGFYRAAYWIIHGKKVCGYHFIFDNDWFKEGGEDACPSGSKETSESGDCEKTS